MENHLTTLHYKLYTGLPNVVVVVVVVVGTRGAATLPFDTHGDVPPSDTPRLAHLRSPWAVLGIAQVGNGSGTHHSYPQHRTPGTRPLPRTAKLFPEALSWQTAQLDGQRGPVSCGTPTTLHPKPASLQYWPLSWQNAQLEKLSTARDGTLIGGALSESASDHTHHPA